MDYPICLFASGAKPKAESSGLNSMSRLFFLDHFYEH
jgi:hypothetical protein